MSEQNQAPRINEMCDKKLPAMLIPVLIFSAVFGGIILVLGEKTFDPAVMKIIRVTLPAFLLLNLALFIRLLCRRVRIDETGVEVSNLLFGSVDLRWEEIRTAAIIKLTIDGKASSAFILLSARSPKESISRQALLQGKGLARDEHVRIPLTVQRSDCVKHYLNMQLPIFEV